PDYQPGSADFQRERTSESRRNAGAGPGGGGSDRRNARERVSRDESQLYVGDPYRVAATCGGRRASPDSVGDDAGARCCSAPSRVRECGRLRTSRACARAREMSLRLAIGAGRGRLVRQLLTESVILALLGGLCGVAVGYGGMQIMKQIQVVADVPIALSFRLDERVLLYSLVAAMGSVFLFGLLPAMRTTRADLTGALRMGGSPSISQSGRPRLWTRNMLVVGQVALSMVLLTVATVMYLTFRRDLLAGPGFRADHVLMTTLDPSLVNY